MSAALLSYILTFHDRLWCSTAAVASAAAALAARLFTLLTMTAVTAFFMMMIAISLTGALKCSIYVAFGSLIYITRNAGTYLDSSLRKCFLRTASNAAADYNINSCISKKTCQRTMSCSI